MFNPFGYVLTDLVMVNILSSLLMHSHELWNPKGEALETQSYRLSV